MGLRTSPVALAALAARAAGSVEGVSGVAPGRPGAATTYGPGERFAGVAIRPGRGGGAASEATIHVTVRYGVSLPEVADAVRAAAQLALDRSDPGHAPWVVHVHVAAIDGDAPAAAALDRPLA